MTILCLCREEHDWNMIPAYADAFRSHGVDFFPVNDSIPFDASLEEVLRTCPDIPSAVFYLKSAHSPFPTGLEHSQIPTVRFHWGTYAFTGRRLRRSAVLDQAVALHPRYRERFARAGPPGAFLLPHAVRRAFFEGAERAREFDVAWVDQTGGPSYKGRAEWLPKSALLALTAKDSVFVAKR